MGRREKNGARLGIITQKQIKGTHTVNNYLQKQHQPVIKKTLSKTMYYNK